MDVDVVGLSQPSLASEKEEGTLLSLFSPSLRGRSLLHPSLFYINIDNSPTHDCHDNIWVSDGWCCLANLHEYK